MLVNWLIWVCIALIYKHIPLLWCKAHCKSGPGFKCHLPNLMSITLHPVFLHLRHYCQLFNRWYRIIMKYIWHQMCDMTLELGTIFTVHVCCMVMAIIRGQLQPNANAGHLDAELQHGHWARPSNIMRLLNQVKDKWKLAKTMHALFMTFCLTNFKYLLKEYCRVFSEWCNHFIWFMMCTVAKAKRKVEKS
jgi:hypothetical protein